MPEEMPEIETFLPLLPLGVRAFALYVQAHALYLKAEYTRSVGIVEAALAMGASHSGYLSASSVGDGLYEPQTARPC